MPPLWILAGADPNYLEEGGASAGVLRSGVAALSCPKLDPLWRIAPEKSAFSAPGFLRGCIQ